MNDICNQLVVISTTSINGKNAGSGFIAKMDGKTYLFTNQHLILGTDSIQFKTVSGKLLRPQKVELSITRDVVRLLLNQPNALEVDNLVKINMPVGVFGNSEGGGVATELFGKVTGIGADVIEISAEFVSGNSGSPVLTTDKKVFGIASYVRIPTPTRVNKGTRFEKKIRRFCYRIANDEWKTVNWRTYNKKYGKVYLKHQIFVDELIHLIEEWSKQPFLTMSSTSVHSALLKGWIKKYNATLETQEKNSSKTFLKQYAKTFLDLEKCCQHEITQIKKFKKDPQLTEFIQEETTKQILQLEFIAEICRSAEHYILKAR